MSIPERPRWWPETDEPSDEELARRQGVGPVTSTEDIKALGYPEAFESDEEFATFLADLSASRRADA